MVKFDLLDKFVKPFKRSVEPLMRKRSEDEVIAAVIDRIPVEEEPVVPDDADRSTKREDEFRRLVRRLEPQFAATGITTDEMLRYYDKPLNAIMLLKFLEKYKKKGSLAIRDRLINLGFVFLQNNVWVLPPARTPQDLKTQEDLKVWVRSTLTKALRKDYQYVMPFVALVDMKKVIAEKHRVVKQPEAKTIFTILQRKELLPASYIYGYMKRKGFSLEGMIRGGDLVFLASAFAGPEAMESLIEKKEEVTRRVRRLMDAEGLSLSYIADLHEKELGGALEGVLPHSLDVARRLGLEAQYWERFLDGESEGPEAVQSGNGKAGRAVSG